VRPDPNMLSKSLLSSYIYQDWQKEIKEFLCALKSDLANTWKLSDEFMAFRNLIDLIELPPNASNEEYVRAAYKVYTMLQEERDKQATANPKPPKSDYQMKTSLIFGYLDDQFILQKMIIADIEKEDKILTESLLAKDYKTCLNQIAALWKTTKWDATPPSWVKSLLEEIDALNQNKAMLITEEEQDKSYSQLAKWAYKRLNDAINQSPVKDSNDITLYKQARDNLEHLKRLAIRTHKDIAYVKNLNNDANFFPHYFDIFPLQPGKEQDPLIDLLKTPGFKPKTKVMKKVKPYRNTLPNKQKKSEAVENLEMITEVIITDLELPEAARTVKCHLDCLGDIEVTFYHPVTKSKQKLNFSHILRSEPDLSQLTIPEVLLDKFFALLKEGKIKLFVPDLTYTYSPCPVEKIKNWQQMDKDRFMAALKAIDVKGVYDKNHPAEILMLTLETSDYYLFINKIFDPDWFKKSFVNKDNQFSFKAIKDQSIVSHFLVHYYQANNINLQQNDYSLPETKFNEFIQEAMLAMAFITQGTYKMKKIHYNPRDQVTVINRELDKDQGRFIRIINNETEQGKFYFNQQSRLEAMSAVSKLPIYQLSPTSMTTNLDVLMGKGTTFGFYPQKIMPIDIKNSTGGRVDSSFGACSLEAISVYPEEKECMLPPGISLIAKGNSAIQKVHNYPLLIKPVENKYQKTSMVACPAYNTKEQFYTTLLNQIRCDLVEQYSHLQNAAATKKLFCQSLSRLENAILSLNSLRYRYGLVVIREDNTSLMESQKKVNFIMEQLPKEESLLLADGAYVFTKLPNEQIIYFLDFHQPHHPHVLYRESNGDPLLLDEMQKNLQIEFPKPDQPQSASATFFPSGHLPTQAKFNIIEPNLDRHPIRYLQALIHPIHELSHTLTPDYLDQVLTSTLEALKEEMQTLPGLATELQAIYDAIHKIVVDHKLALENSPSPKGKGLI
jgi:hypothetical protein